MPPSVCWFRRDLRLDDHPALAAAAAGDREVVPLFVLDDRLRRSSGGPRLAYLYRCLRDLRERTDGRLVVVRGDPVSAVPAVAARHGAEEVHVSAAFGPYGSARDEAVAAALAAAGRRLVVSGSPYAAEPGTVTKGDGAPFRVFSPFYRVWRSRGVAPPLAVPAPRWASDGGGEAIPPDPDLGAVTLPPAGEAAARDRLATFLADGVARYAERRDRPGEDGTSRLSVDLKFGCLHPRTVLAPLGRGRGPETFRKELAWREFYADVLWVRPDSAWRALQPALAGLAVDTGAAADARFAAWAEGRTGYPIVDAGMRQLAAEAWMHNRVRMIVASFLVKDLHLPWQRGARFFLERLRDGDLASNNHGWQWVAGTGTDPAPFFRIFNPVLQGRKFDPDGAYIRRWVPELVGCDARVLHEPWTAPGGPPAGYPAPIVEHAAERREALRRYDLARGTG